MRRGSALLVLLLVQGAVLFALAATTYSDTPATAPAYPEDTVKKSLLQKVKDAIATEAKKKQLSKASYDSNKEELEDAVKGYLDNKGTAKKSPSPAPKVSPSPPKPVERPAYAPNPYDDYPIPSKKGDYHADEWVGTPSPKPQVIYDYAVGPTVPKTIYHPFSSIVKDGYPTTKYPPMQCKGNAYCFKQCFDKSLKSPYCPKGWEYNDMKDRCEKSIGWACPEWALDNKDTVEAPPKCFACPSDYKYDKSIGKCALACDKGYTLVNVNGTKYCVEDCPEGYFAYGSTCVSQKCYNPAGCGEAACLPGYSFYWVNVPSDKTGSSAANGYASTSGSVKPTVVADGYDGEWGYPQEIYADKTVKKLLEDMKKKKIKPDLNCKCCATVKRDAYVQKCEPPFPIKPKEKTSHCPRVCPEGCPLDLDGLCHCPCPAGCEAGEKCCYPCPAGMTECKYHGRSFCATKGKMCGVKLDSCSVLSVLYDGLDNSYICPSPQAIQAVANIPVVWVNGTATPTSPVVTVTTTAAAGKA